MCSIIDGETLLAMKRTHDALVDLDRRRRQLPFMSATAFSAMITDIKKHGLPELVTSDTTAMRNLVMQARDAVLGTRTDYGELFHKLRLDGKPGKQPVAFEHVNVQAYLQYIYSLGGSFMRLVDSMHARQPSSPESPWGIIVYTDEVEPGNELAARHERKLYAFYFAIRECGPLILSNTDAWITLAAHASHEVHQVAGGLPAIMAVLLESMFTGVHSMREVGVVLNAPDGRQTRVFFDLAMFLMDGAAHKELWSVKGDGGMFFCMFCPALCTRSSEIAQYAGDRLLICDFMPEDLGRCHTATDASIRATVRRLAEFARAHPNLLDKRQQVVGFNHDPHNLLLNPRLDNIVKPESQFCHDGMHLLLSNGVINHLVILLFEKARSLNLNAYQAFDAFLQRYKWPNAIQAHHSKGLYQVFSPPRVERSRDSGKLICTASELLSLLPLLDHFARKHLLPNAEMRDATECFIAGIDVAETFFAIPKGGVTPDMLKTRTETFASLVIVAGWSEYTTPKFHWLIHLWREFAKFLFLPTCFAAERKNQNVKRAGVPVRNTTKYNHSIIADVTAAHAAAMASPSTFDVRNGLVKPRPAPAKMCTYLMGLFDNVYPAHQFRTSHIARFSVDGVCAKGDVVLLQHCAPDVVAAEVWFHFDLAEEPAALVSMWPCIEMDKDGGYALWRKIDDPRVVLLEDIVGVCMYATYDDGTVKTLLPRQV